MTAIPFSETKSYKKYCKAIDKIMLKTILKFYTKKELRDAKRNPSYATRYAN